jgi:7-carboxy-7-deazaguanine synthase
MLPVNEIFETVQGEAYFAGTPSVFIRLQGCEVGCPWCDTKHTWGLDPTQVVSLKELMREQASSPHFAWAGTNDIANEAMQLRPRHTVITGGEPGRYDLRRLTGELLDRGRDVQIETSGTEELLIDNRVWVTLSPKINMPGGRPMIASAMARAQEIKLPVGKLEDVEAYDELVKTMPASTALIWVQPLSMSLKAARVCMAAALDRGWRVSVQTHRLLGVR